MFVHQHAVVTHPTVETTIESGDLEIIYVIKTNLPLVPDDPKYDKEALDELIEAARRYFLENHQEYDRIRIDPASENQ